MTRELFDDLIGSPPVSTVDVERIMVERDRGRRRRRLFAACGAAVGVAAIVAAGVLRPAVPAEPGLRPPVVLTQYADFAAWIDREVAAAVPALRWTGAGDRAYSAHDGEPPPDGFSYRRQFAVDGWQGAVEVYIVPLDPGRPVCDGLGNRPECRQQADVEPGVDCAVAGGIEVLCARDGLPGQPELRIIGDRPPPFDVGLLVPVVARLATRLPPAIR